MVATNTNPPSQSPKGLHKDAQQRLDNILTRLRSLLGDGQWHKIPRADFAKTYGTDHRVLSVLVDSKALEQKKEGNVLYYRRRSGLAQMQVTVLHSLMAARRAKDKAIQVGTTYHTTTATDMTSAGTPTAPEQMITHRQAGSLNMAILQRFSLQTGLSGAALKQAYLNLPLEDALEKLPQERPEIKLNPPETIIRLSNPMLEAANEVPVVPLPVVAPTPKLTPVSHALPSHPLCGEIRRLLGQQETLRDLNKQRQELDKQIAAQQELIQKSIEGFYYVNRRLEHHRFVYQDTNHGSFLVTTSPDKTLDVRRILVEVA
ncbi:hypothetical protein GCM10028806_34020 [Spirosoma terrae]|uniref:Uncharacterized protein n=1 Tax=Spirosoma terrae TaxID=1968276 RepID=A0A6L9L516_9BACT|nr:hypothetical protein [Spirosoma terrae]NDU95715.1 hypothetical protein [Spirosoma terrae]